MSNDRIEGAARKGLGHVQDAVGGLVGDSKAQITGKLNQAAGAAQNAYGQVKDQAEDVYAQAKGRAQDAYGNLETYARSQPLIAVGVGFGVGLALGFLMRSGRRAA
jgi:uncharacterized protein YjbJ (UPF0337 family)